MIQEMGTLSWRALTSVTLGDLPDLGRGPGAYVLRDIRTGDVLYICGTSCLRRRLFGNYLGGVGGATTQRVHRLLFADGHVDHVEVAVVPGRDGLGVEAALKADYSARHGRPLPPWNRR